MSDKTKGLFIVMEGLDGSGQTTQVALLKDYLERKGYQVISTKEPTKDSSVAEKIREALDEKVKIDPLELQKLFTEDRREHLEKLIIPALKEGKIVISDRYYFSTFAFGTSDKLSMDELIEMNKEFLNPDLIVILKVSPKVCVERINKRGEAVTLFEKENKLIKVWDNFAVLPEKFNNAVIVNGEREREIIHEEIKNLVESKLKI